MKPSHPPALLTLVRRTAHEERLFAPGDVVLVAVSGGPDSVALLHVLARLADSLRVRVVAHGVDHGLRAQASDELALAARVAADLGVRFQTTRVRVETGSNLMARARHARYAALRDAAAAEGARAIATGHHADDRAETVLMRILRGTGTAGLHVLAPRSGDLVRPLIRARRSDIAAHLERHELPFADDPSNRDPRFLRSRVRHELLPALVRLSPRIVEHLCALADAAGPAVEVPAEIDGARLGRAQRETLGRALRDRNAAIRVPIAGGKVVTLDLSTGGFVVIRER